MRIVLVSTDRELTPPRRGGAIGTWVFEFAKELARRGHDVIIIGKSNPEVDYRQLGVVFISLPDIPAWIRSFNIALHGNLSIIFYLSKLLTLRELFRDVDIVQTHYFTTSLAIPMLCKDALLVQVWHNIPKASIVNKVLAKRFDLVCGVSKLITRKIVELLGVAIEKTYVLYDFVNTDRFRPDNKLREAYREKLGLEDCECAILYVGRIIPRKGLHYLILALRALARHYRFLKLIIIGPEGHFDKAEPAYPHLIRQMIRKFELEKYVIWLGNVHSSELPGIYNAADLVVIPTVMEEGGVLLITLEAMASAKPVVAFSSGALPEAIEHMKTGILVPKGDVNALSKSIELLVTDKQLRLRLGENARRVCETKFSVRAVVDTALRMYKKFFYTA